MKFLYTCTMLLFISVMSIQCHTSRHTIASSEPKTPTGFYVKMNGHNIAFYRYNKSVSKFECFVVQDAQWKIPAATVTDVQYSEGAYLEVATDDKLRYFFRVDGKKTDKVNIPSIGIMKMTTEESNKQQQSLIVDWSLQINSSDATHFDCSSGGCGAKTAGSSVPLTNGQCHVSCSEGYFPCVKAESVFGSRCISSKNCK